MPTCVPATAASTSFIRSVRRGAHLLEQRGDPLRETGR